MIDTKIQTAMRTIAGGCLLLMTDEQPCGCGVLQVVRYIMASQAAHL
jgi:hypothetical protein